MGIEFYKIMHLTGIFMVFISLGGLIIQVGAGKAKDFPGKKLIAITHGVGLLVALVGGFGLMARLEIKTWDGWLLVKLALWLVLGGLTVLIKKSSGKMTMVWWALTVFIGITALYMVNFKPF